MQALGMIEVIGLPPAMEAADAALKAANVTLLAIAKADAGILTIEITGDVGAVTAAVEAGAAAASRVGTLRAKHIIPRVDESLIGKVIMQGTTLFQPKKKAEDQAMAENIGEDMVDEVNTIGRDDTFGESTLSDNIETNPEEEKTEAQPEVIYTAAELKKKSNDTLRGILQSRGVELTEQHKNAKKQELIQLILTIQNRR